MRRSLIAAAMALMVMAGQASAQLFPTTTPGAEPLPLAAERVVFDAEIMAFPRVQIAPCMRLEAGTLTVKARVISAINRWPTRLSLNGFQGTERTATIDLALGDEEASASVPLNGGNLYCWSLDIDAPVARNPSVAEASTHVQYVAIKMTLAPR